VKLADLPASQIAKREVIQIEQLNILGRRSGNGFVAHKTALVNALSRALSDRVMLLDYTIGRKGFINYLKSLGGSNIVKIVPSTSSGQVPSNVSASEAQTDGQKRLKVTCGSHTSYLEDMVWIGDNTPMTLCEVRISPNRTVKPNIGGLELSEALDRVLPFANKEDNRPVLQCVLFKAVKGKLTLVSADGYRLAVVTLDYEGEGQALILRDDLKGISSALRKAHRVNLSFEKSGESLDSTDLIIDTEITRYKWLSVDGEFPDYEKLIPVKPSITAHLDTVEARKALASLKVLADAKSYPIDLHLNDGVVMSSPDDKGQVTMPADIEGGEVRVRIDGGYLSEALKACGGMADFKVTDAKSPVLFVTEGYQLVVMPMLTGGETAETTGEGQQAEIKPETETETGGELAESKAKAVAEAEKAVKSSKPKRSRKKEPVAVA
jgi:DNA polymerase-3 subunit beta